MSSSLLTHSLTQWFAEKFVKKLFGENDVNAVLQRLDRLTQDEARTTAAQTLEVVYGLFQNMKVVIDGESIHGIVDRRLLSAFPFRWRGVGCEYPECPWCV